MSEKNEKKGKIISETKIDCKLLEWKNLSENVMKRTGERQDNKR